MSFLEDINKAKTKLIELQTIKKMKELSLLEKQQALDYKEQYQLDAEKARVIIQAVASDIQKNLEYQISSIVTMALSAVFDDAMEFKTQFVERRNQTEVDFYFVDSNGNECEPMDDGGGAKDIASLALRFAIWSLKKTRNTMILDEPSRNVSVDMQEKVSEMLKMISKELQLQMIIVSHIPGMISAADRIINVVKKDGISEVTVL